MEPNVIDRLREQIQERLDQLAGEADRLRKALAALDPRSSKTPARKPPVRKPAQRTASKPTASATKSAARRTSQPAARSPRRTAPGATKASVLAALAGGEAMTAGQVAAKAGLHLALKAGVRRRFAPHQLRHAHAVELLHEGIPLPLIQRQLGHSHLSTTTTYLQGIDTPRRSSRPSTRGAGRTHARDILGTPSMVVEQYVQTKSPPTRAFSYGPWRTRTSNLGIKSPLLYQLS
jgi:Phage integrase family